jgi:hypothetical protein
MGLGSGSCPLRERVGHLPNVRVTTIMVLLDIFEGGQDGQSFFATFPQGWPSSPRLAHGLLVDERLTEHARRDISVAIRKGPMRFHTGPEKQRGIA